MKNTLLMLLLMVGLSPLAEASKARMNALQAAPHIKDFQWIFDNPTHLNYVPDQFLLELGDGNSSTSQYKLGPNVSLFAPTAVVKAGPTMTMNIVPEPGAEGGFLMTQDDSKWGFYMGRKSGVTTQGRLLFGFLGQENPIEFMYGLQGDLNWAVTASYSNSDKKETGGKQQAYGIRTGVSTDVWDAYALFGLGSGATGADLSGDGTLATAAETDVEYKGSPSGKLGGGYHVDSTYFYGSVVQEGFKVNNLSANATRPFILSTGLANIQVADANGTFDLALTTIEVGLIESLKVEGGEFFYGASYQSLNMDNKAVDTPTDVFKISRTTLPILLGMEVTATEWLALRGSVKQPVLLGTSKTADADAVTLDNTTTLGLGASFKLAKWTLDTTLTGSANGRFDFGTNAFANASLNYNF